jgi:hypothetical protein
LSRRREVIDEIEEVEALEDILDWIIKIRGWKMEGSGVGIGVKVSHCE